MTKQTVYHRLNLVAEKDDTDIWIGDDEGHFVAHGQGKMEEGLMPDTYMVTFGDLGNKKHRVDLKGNTTIYEKDLDNG